MFKNPFSFKGRIRRTEFGFSFIIYLVFYFVVLFAMQEFISDTPGLLFLLLIPALWFLYAQGAKRSHDIGNSGWYQLIPFYVIALIFIDSKSGPNKYGDNPKGVGNDAEIEEIGKTIQE